MMGKKLSSNDIKARQDSRMDFPKPLPILEVGKKYEFKEMTQEGKIKTMKKTGEELENIIGTIIGANKHFYIVKTKNYVTSIHKNAIDTSMKAVLIK